MKHSKRDNDNMEKISNREKNAIKKGGQKEKIKQERRKKRKKRATI